MQLIPSEEEVRELLSETGALRTGHYEYPSGLHSEIYVNVPMAMRSYQNARTMGVGLSRKVRENSELHAMIGDLSVVAPQSSGIPVAYAVCEALRASQVYWAEREGRDQPLYFRQGIGEKTGEKVLIVDDILRTGRRLRELKQLVESLGDEVVGVAVMVYQPGPVLPELGSVPFFYLTRVNGKYFPDASHCEMCRAGVPLQKAQV